MEFYVFNEYVIRLLDVWIVFKLNNILCHQKNVGSLSSFRLRPLFCHQIISLTSNFARHQISTKIMLRKI